MSNYIDYDYYSNTFKGTLIPQKEFEQYATKASNEVRLRILNKSIKGFEKEVQNATCSVADILYNQELKKQRIESILNGTEKIITSEKVGDYSRNISTVSLSDLKADYESADKKIDDELNKTLLFTGLLYLGIIDVR